MENNKNEVFWKSIGHFLLLLKKDPEEGNYIIVRSLNAGWEIRWRDDTPMFGSVLYLANDGTCDNYLDGLFSFMYVATSHPHDAVSIGNDNGAPVIDGFAKLFAEQSEYEASFLKREGDEEILKEEAEVDDILETAIKEALEEGKEI